MDIGFVGLGQMGQGMAANLLKAGHNLRVYNRSADKAAGLVAQGAVLAKTPGAAAHGAAVVTMLADDHAVEAVAFGPDGIIAALAPGAIHMSCSTISVALAERLAAAHAKAGQRFVSAPVFGRPDAAAAARLFIAAAGAPDALADCAPLFAAMALVGKGGVDLHAYLDLLTSTLFSAPVYKTYGALIAGGVFEPAGFAAPLGQKDIRLTLAAAEGLRVPMPLASLLRDRFLTLLATGGEAMDWSAIGKLAARDSGQ
jgi:3-hydroxyisobutyrate dehydrogenase-like beta-hydroxyacid dehydrogenase